MRKRIISYALMCSVCSTLVFSTTGAVYATNVSGDTSTTEIVNGDGDFISDDGDDDFVSDDSDDFISDDGNDDFVEDDVEIPVDSGEEDEHGDDTTLGVTSDTQRDDENEDDDMEYVDHKEVVTVSKDKQSTSQKTSGKAGKVKRQYLSKTGDTGVLQTLKDALDGVIYDVIKAVIG